MTRKFNKLSSLMIQPWLFTYELQSIDNELSTAIAEDSYIHVDKLALQVYCRRWNTEAGHKYADFVDRIDANLREEKHELISSMDRT